MTYVTVGIVIISVASAYAWWTRIRVLKLRQDLFDIRDHLFDAAVACGAVEHPAHAEARQHLNHLARSAELISVPMVIFALGTKISVSAIDVRAIENQELRRAVVIALGESAARIRTYIFYHTGLGLLMQCVFRILMIEKALEMGGARLVTKWVESSSIDSVQPCRSRA